MVVGVVLGLLKFHPRLCLDTRIWSRIRPNFARIFSLHRVHFECKNIILTKTLSLINNITIAISSRISKIPVSDRLCDFWLGLRKSSARPGETRRLEHRAPNASDRYQKRIPALQWGRFHPQPGSILISRKPQCCPVNFCE